MTFRRPGSLLVAAFADSAASAVNEAAKKTRLVPVVMLMTKVSTRWIGPETFAEGFSFQGHYVAHFNSNLHLVSQLKVGKATSRSELWLPKIVSGMAQMPQWAILALGCRSDRIIGRHSKSRSTTANVMRLPVVGCGA